MPIQLVLAQQLDGMDDAERLQKLDTSDKRNGADRLYRLGIEIDEIAGLLSITPKTATEYARKAKADERAEQQARAWELWLDCWSAKAIAKELGITDMTGGEWVQEERSSTEILQSPESRQHFDVWSFQTADKDSGQQSYFGAIPPQVVENLLWFWTEPGYIVVDPFAGSGTTIDVAKAMGRRVWASDRRGNDYSPLLPIHTHDITTGWPADAPKREDLILLDPPYWRQAAGKYSDDPNNDVTETRALITA